MENSKFDKIFQKLMEDVTTTSAGVGSTQDSTIQSNDTYAPGDSRTPVVLNKKKKNKMQVIKRTSPAPL